MTDRARQSQRYPAMQDLQVRCETWSEFATLYAVDVSQGGMFLATDEAPPVLSRIEVRLMLPEAHEVRLEARVVHVLDTATAAQEGKPAGVGVEFVELDERRQREIMQLVEYARWEGSKDNASLAKAMFEMSDSVATSKVLASLPAERYDPPPESRTSQPGTSTSQVRASSAGASAGDASAERQALRRRRARRRRSGDTTYRTIPIVQDDLSVDGKPSPRSSREPTGRTRTTSSELRRPSTSGQPPAAEAAPADAPEAAQAAPPAEGDGQQAPKGGPKPTDTIQLKVGMKHFAHRRYHEAIEVFSAMLEDNPGDPQALKWLHMSQARISVTVDDEDSALQHYKQVLAYDEGHHEALKYVRSHGKKGLGALGRLFKRGK